MSYRLHAPWRRTVWLALFAGLLALAGCASEVQRGLTETAADRIVVALARAGVPAEKEADESQGQGPPTYRVLVPSADTTRALSVLTAEGLPRDPPRGYGSVYGQGSLVPSATEERARYVEALSGELEATLLRIDGVLDARVHIVLPSDDDLRPPPELGGPPPQRATASVLLKVAPGAAGLSDGDVARLVAGAVPGLAPADVAVVSTAAVPPVRADVLTHVGPVWVASGSRGVLLATLATLLFLVAGLSVGLILMARRLRASA